MLSENNYCRKTVDFLVAESKISPVVGNYDFVIFFPCDWETPWRGHYLIQALSEQLKNSKILCVENPIDLLVSLVKHSSKLHSRIRKGNVVRRVCQNPYIYRPWIFLNVHIASKFPLIQKLNLKWMKFQLDNVVKRSNFRANSLITWFTDPFQADYLNVLDAKFTVFDCYDEYAAQSINILFRTKKELMEKEKRILQNVDLTFVVSDLLYDNKRPHARAIHIIPNAVDINHFGKAARNSTTIAEDILHIPHPIIGFHGNLSDRIDIDLLDWLAARNKDWSIVMVGGKEGNMKNKQLLMKFAERKNVYLLGNKPYEDLPEYLKAFDVCMIPFREDDLFSLSCSPIKLYEYLATGKPIVSTELPGVHGFKSLVRIAKGREELERQIKEALKEGFQLCEKRISISKGHSWKRRAKQVKDILDEMVNGAYM